MLAATLSLAVAAAVAPAADKLPSIILPAGRCCYVAGENISVRVQLPPGVYGKAELLLQSDSEQPVATITEEIAKGGQPFIRSCTIDANLLVPGSYRLLFRSGTVKCQAGLRILPQPARSPVPHTGRQGGRVPGGCLE